VLSGVTDMSARIESIPQVDQTDLTPAICARGLSTNTSTGLTSKIPQGEYVRYSALLVFAFIASSGLLALINQAFWDDTVILAYSHSDMLWEFFKQMGRREQFMLVEPFARAGEPRIWITAALLLDCLLAPLIYTIIRRTLQWPSADAFWAALLTALAPLDQARFVLSIIPYTFSRVFFALSIVLLLCDLERPLIRRRLLIAFLLIMAFSTNSFLVLAWIPPMIVVVSSWRNLKGEQSLLERGETIIRTLVQRSELIFLAPVYWLAKELLEPTYGLYDNYNHFRLGVVATLEQTVFTFINQFGENASVLIPARSDLLELGVAAAVIASVFAAAAWILRLPLRTQHADQSRLFVRGITLLFGLALILSALFPYVAVGQPPRFSGLWETRHQTTLMMVSGFVIVALLRFILPRRLVSITAAIIAAGFLVIDISVTHQLIADALEIRAVTALFKQHPVSPGTMVLYVEDDHEYRALGRFLVFYELSTMVNTDKAEGPSLVISNQSVLDPLTRDYPTAAIPAVVSSLIGLCQNARTYPQYGFDGFISNGKIETIKISAIRPPPKLFQTIGEAVRLSVGTLSDQELASMVRAKSDIEPIGGACISPCCSNS
jgi:hypothetical protein